MKKTLLAGLLCCFSTTSISDEVSLQSLQAQAIEDAKQKAEELRAGSQRADAGSGVDAAVAEIARRSQTIMASAATPTVPIAEGVSQGQETPSGENRNQFQAIKDQSLKLAEQQQSLSQMVADASRTQAASNETAKSIGTIYKDVNAKALKNIMGGQQSGVGGVDVVRETGLLFLSMSMPDNDVSAALEMASSHGVRVAFVGLPNGTRNIPEAMRFMKKLAAKAKIEPANEPDVGIDPNAFTKYGVRVVPTLVRETGDGHFHRLEGSINWSYFDDSIKQMPQGQWLNLQAGQVWKIEEINLIEEMKQRMAAIDWEAKKKGAIERFWSNQKMHHLPAATKTERWMIDPTVRVTKDMQDRSGQLIARAGTVLNPLASAHVPLRLLVINPASERELQWAVQYQQSNPFGGQTMVLGTDFTTKGWDVMQKASNTLQARIRLAPPELINRFRLTATPAVIQTIGKAFGVQQLALDKEEAE